MKTGDQISPPWLVDWNAEYGRVALQLSGRLGIFRQDE
jgi:hypothetical protein